MCTAVDYLSTAGYDYMPTKYDQTGFIWNHGSSVGNIIIATIAYNETVYNINELYNG